VDLRSAERQGRRGRDRGRGRRRGLEWHRISASPGRRRRSHEVAEGGLERWRSEASPPLHMLGRGTVYWAGPVQEIFRRAAKTGTSMNSICHVFNISINLFGPLNERK
jgi:hypothetical protein